MDDTLIHSTQQAEGWTAKYGLDYYQRGGIPADLSRQNDERPSQRLQRDRGVGFLLGKKSAYGVVENRRFAIYIISYVFFVALQYQFAKNALLYASPSIFMTLRFAVAASVAFVLAGSSRPTLNFDTVLLGVFTWVSSALWILGLESVSPSQSAVVSYTMPFFAIPFSRLLLGEKETPMQWVGTVIGFSGTLVYGLELSNTGATMVGGVLTAGSAVFWALFTVYYRKLKEQNILLTVGTQCLISALLFSAMTPFDLKIRLTESFYLDLGFVSLLGGLGAFVLWNAMAKIQPIGRLTTLAFAVPAVTIVLQSLETVTTPPLPSLVGLSLMFLGIYVSYAIN